MKKFGLTAMALLLAAALGIAISVSATHANSGESADTAGAAPSGLTATYADGQLTLTWTKGTDATYLKQFIENRVAGATPADWWITVAPTDMESFTLPAEMTVAGTTYDFRVSGAKLVNGVVTSVASSNCGDGGNSNGSVRQDGDASVASAKSAGTGPGAIRPPG